MVLRINPINKSNWVNLEPTPKYVLSPNQANVYVLSIYQTLTHHIKITQKIVNILELNKKENK